MGAFQVDPEVIESAFSPSSKVKPFKGVCVPKPCVGSPAVLDMCTELCDKGVITCVDGCADPPPPTMNVSLHPKPNNQASFC